MTAESMPKKINNPTSISLLENVNREVGELISQLAKYRKLEMELKNLENIKMSKPRGFGMLAKFNSPDIVQLDTDIKNKKQELKLLGEAMKFQDPYNMDAL